MTTPGNYQNLDNETGEVIEDKPVNIQEEDEKKGLFAANEEEDLEDLNPVQKVLLIAKKYLSHASLVASIIAYLIIAVFLVVILICVILLIVFAKHAKPKTPFKFNSMFDPSLKPRGFNMQFADETNIFYWKIHAPATQKFFSVDVYKELKNGPRGANGILCELAKSSVNETKEEIIVTDELRAANGVPCGAPFFPSASGNWIIFEKDEEAVFRHTTKGVFLAYSVPTKSFQGEVTQHPGKKQAFVRWCPTDRNVVAYVEENNIYVRDYDKNTYFTVTSDGSENRFNGVPDWLYEEEVMASAEALEWSPDCSLLMYLKLDDNKVQSYNIPDVQNPQITNFPYPTGKTIKYPAAGMVNPTVGVSIYSFEDKKNYVVDLKTEYPDQILVNKFDFVRNTKTNGNFYVVTTNRIQTEKQILYANIADRLPEALHVTPKTISKMNHPTAAFEGLEHNLFFLDFNNSVAYIDVSQNFEQDFVSLELFDAKTGASIKKLMDNPQSNVLSIIENVYNPNTKEIYYYRTKDTQLGSLHQRLYSVNLETGQETCISCQLFGDNEHFVTVHAVSPNSGNMFLSYDGPEMPKYLMLDSTTKLNVRTFVDNSDIEEVRKPIASPKVEVKMLNKDISLAIHYPADFSDSKTYPVILFMYGGPGAVPQTAAQWSTRHDTFAHFMTSLGFIYVVADGRGGAQFRRGISHKYSNYRQLGRVETDDYNTVAKYMKDLAYVDPAKMAVWGWSYGGFMTLSLVTSEENAASHLWRMGVAVAPPTEWRLYDSAYTERYMQTPDMNPLGYNSTSILNRIRDQNTGNCNTNTPLDLIDEKKTALVVFHGDADDNVHPQNTYLLARDMQYCGIPFRMMIYPNQAHSISDARRFVYKMISIEMSQTMLGKINAEAYKN